MKKTKTKRGEIADQFRKMKVGQTIFFPIDKYNPQTIRATPSSTLYKERAAGMKWITEFDVRGKRIAVTRVL